LAAHIVDRSFVDRRFVDHQFVDRRFVDPVGGANKLDRLSLTIFFRRG
jgi:hypothetical protein